MTKSEELNKIIEFQQQIKQFKNWLMNEETPVETMKRHYKHSLELWASLEVHKKKLAKEIAEELPFW